MAYRYCWSCGTLLHEPPPTYCEHCGQRHFRNPKPCGEAIVIEHGRVLLMRRAKEPFKDAWDVPGGFCEGDEHPMHAAERELEEELGIAAEAVAYVGTWIDVYGPPAVDGIQEHTVNSAYIMRLRAPIDELRLQADEVLEAGGFRSTRCRAAGFPGHMRPMLAAATDRYSAPDVRALPDRIW